MKLTVILLLLLSATARADVLSIPPLETGAGIQQIQGPHLAYFDPHAQNENGLLLISIAGTSSKPSNLAVIDERAVKQGYNVIAVDYPNSVISTVCRESQDPECSEKFRREIVNGEPVATDPSVNVDKTNSLENRIRALLAKLASKDAKRWSPYLKNNGEVNWKNIVLIGHSQGSGHATFLAKNHKAHGAIIIAGPQDRSIKFGPADWLKQPFATNKKDLLFLMHADDYFQFGKQEQLENVRAILGANAPITDAANPQETSQILFSRTHSGQKNYDAHNAIITAEYEKQFDYLLKRAAIGETIQSAKLLRKAN